MADVGGISIAACNIQQQHSGGAGSARGSPQQEQQQPPGRFSQLSRRERVGTWRAFATADRAPAAQCPQQQLSARAPVARPAHQTNVSGTPGQPHATQPLGQQLMELTLHAYIQFQLKLGLAAAMAGM